MKKTIYKNFDYTQCNEFATYLSEMAAQGWHFKEWSLGLVFEKGDAKQIEYAVEIFIHGKEEDMRPAPQTEEFAEYCEMAGWEFVDAKRKFCVFRKLREDAVEIVTLEERVENIKNAEIARINSGRSLYLWYIIWTLIQISSDVTAVAFDGMRQLVLLTLGVALLFSAFDVIRVKKWAKEKQCLSPLKRNRIVEKIWGILVAVILVSYCILEKEYIGLAVLFAVVILLILIDLIMKKCRPSRTGQTLIGAGLLLSMIFIMSIVVTVIFNNDSEKVTYENRIDRSLLGTLEVGYYDYDETQIITYKKYCSNRNWLMNKVWIAETEYVSNEAIAVNGLDVEEIKSLSDWKYMIRNPQCIVVIENAEDISWDEIKEIIEEIGVR